MPLSVNVVDWDGVEVFNAPIGRQKMGITGVGGVPAGGTTGQVLEKNSNADGDVSWDTLPLPSGLFTAQNKGVNFWIGAAIARHSSGTGLILADATVTTHKSIGFATVGAATGFSESVQLEGPFVLNDWTAIIGAASLQPLADYFLSLTPGMLTSVSPINSGQVSQAVGFAVSPTTLIVEPLQAILL